MKIIKDITIIPVIMCGGEGSRLWSRLRLGHYHYLRLFSLRNL